MYMNMQAYNDDPYVLEFRLYFDGIIASLHQHTGQGKPPGMERVLAYRFRPVICTMIQEMLKKCPLVLTLTVWRRASKSYEEWVSALLRNTLKPAGPVRGK